MENCQELILDDIIKIDIYNKDNVAFSAPFNAPAVREMMCAIPLGVTPVLSINLSETNTSDVVMEPGPKLQVAEKREAAGLVRSIAIEATVTGGFKTAQAAVDALIYNDIAAIATTSEGTRYAINPFPNTTTLSMADNRQQEHTMTVRYAAQSYSGLVKLVT